MHTPSPSRPTTPGAIRGRPGGGIRARLAKLAALGCVVATLAACGLHSGGDALAFVRAGNLWVMNGDGSGARELARGGVAGFAWSPDHHQIVYRTGATLPSGDRAAPDAPGALYVVSINGGSPVPITPNEPGIARSDAWWDANGNRLLYREEFASAETAGDAAYVVSQADQPAGIARKGVVDAAGLPVLAPDGGRIAVIGPDGAVRVGTPGAAGSVVASGALITLPTTGRPARLLWQPRHDALLYATADGAGVALMLHDLGGTPSRRVGSVSALLDVAFSPDGAWLLVRTPTNFEVWSVAQPGAPLFRWDEADALAEPWWAPDGQRLLVRDTAGLHLVAPTQQKVVTLLSHTVDVSAAPPIRWWQPGGSSPWSPRSDEIVFNDDGQGTWGGDALPQPHAAGAALYVGRVGVDGRPGAVTLIESAADEAPSWSYLDPSTTYLVPG